MKGAHNRIKKFVGASADSWIPYEENASAYNKANMNVSDMDGNQLKSARTNQSIWSVVNGMTHVATHAPEMIAMNMTDKDSTEMMVQAGNVLGKQWNLQGSMRSPFDADAHLETSMQVGAILN